MMIAKRILCSERLRRLPGQFSWIDHRLVRRKHICGISHRSLALYLFLVTVGDAEGLSYYSDSKIEEYLSFDAGMLSFSRTELCKAGLVAYRHPIYQVLSLDEDDVSQALNTLPEKNMSDLHLRGGEPDTLGVILRRSLPGGGTQ